MPNPHRDSEPGVDPEVRSSPNRRKFLQTLGATAALPWVAAWPAAAQAPAKPAPAPAPPPSSPPDPDAAAAQADSRNLVEMLQRRYGANWTPEQVEALRSDLEDGVSGGRVLRKLELRNADEPAVIFVTRVPEV